MHHHVVKMGVVAIASPGCILYGDSRPGLWRDNQARERVKMHVLLMCGGGGGYTGRTLPNGWCIVSK